MDWLATPEAMALYAKNFAVVAMPGMAKPLEFVPADYEKRLDQERLRLGGEEPRQDPRRVDQALRRQVGAEVARSGGAPARQGARSSARSPDACSPGDALPF